MQNRTIEIKYKQYPSPDALPAEERQLLGKAIQATSTAYSPYSHFCVGAAVLLANGEIVTGSNQENVAYPSGLCAERTAMFSASAQYPKVPMRKIAIVGKNADGELCAATPCGACRQVMSEYQDVAGENIEIILYSEGGTVLLFDGIDSLLPLRFSF
ncbi:MAG: cytidine deaminase [Bacteroidales bacterium]|nr:cytidine deaminase [Bacteroidales bacterium]